MKCSVCSEDILRGRLKKHKAYRSETGLEYDDISCPYCKTEYYLLSNPDDYLILENNKTYSKDKMIAERVYYAKKQCCSIREAIIPSTPEYLGIITPDDVIICKSNT